MTHGLGAMFCRAAAVLLVLESVWASFGPMAFAGGGLRLRNSSDTALFFALPDPYLTHVQAIPPRRPSEHCASNQTRHENLCMRRLTARIVRLENSLAALCSALMHADDVAFNERKAAKMGDVFQDSNMQNKRRPRWLRRSVQDVATQYSIMIMPPEVKWHRVSDTKLDDPPHD